MKFQPDPQSAMRVHHRTTPKRRRTRPEDRSGPVERSWVHPGLLATARRIAAERGGRVNIVTPTKIEVVE